MLEKGSFDVVTGGAGFIGSHICRTLLRRGRKVRVIDDLSTGNLENIRDMQEQFTDSIEFIQLDIRDQDRLRRSLDGAGTIYHQAAIPSVQRSIEDPLRSNSVNVDGTVGLMVAAREVGVKRFIYASSSSVYGESETLPKTESMTANPISPYAVSKYVTELYAGVFGRLYGLGAVGLRYFNVFGPHQDPTSDYAAVIPRFITRMLSGEPPVIFGDGEQSRDFTYVENAVRANLKAADSDAGGIVLNVACGERYSLNTLVQMLNEILGTSFEPVYEDPRPGDIRHSLADISRAEEVIGYQVEVNFREGLRRTVEWFQKQLLESQEKTGKG